jgi:hypothetical protein
VFSDEAGSTYDNAGGADFYLPVRQPEPLQVNATLHRVHHDGCALFDTAAPMVHACSCQYGLAAALLHCKQFLEVACGDSTHDNLFVCCLLQELTFTPATTSRADHSQGTVTPALAADAYACIIAAAADAAASPADEQAAAAAANCNLFFSMPPVPVAGAVAMLYVNRARLQCGLGQAPNVQLNIGFNDWQMGHQTVSDRLHCHNRLFAAAALLWLQL